MGKYKLIDLKWDSDYFGVPCAKVVLNDPITQDEFLQIKMNFNKYKFVSIINKNSEPVNAQLITRETKAFIADINIQFVKDIKSINKIQTKTQILNNFEGNDEILKLVKFPCSKFEEDKQLQIRGGEYVYNHWVRNSFNNPDKYFVLSRDDHNQINGFLLHSYKDDACIIELIAVSENSTKSGIGTKLFNSLELSTFNKGISRIQVGTQVRNHSAVNFYHKMGCKQVGCHQVYHLWKDK